MTYKKEWAYFHVTCCNFTEKCILVCPSIIATPTDKGMLESNVFCYPVVSDPFSSPQEYLHSKAVLLYKALTLSENSFFSLNLLSTQLDTKSFRIVSTTIHMLYFDLKQNRRAVLYSTHSVGSFQKPVWMTYVVASTVDQLIDIQAVIYSKFLARQLQDIDIVY